MIAAIHAVRRVQRQLHERAVERGGVAERWKSCLLNVEEFTSYLASPEPYLDVIAEASTRLDVPLAAYHVSGEFAMIHAAAERGWIDGDAVALEHLTAIKRAGADIVLTYFARWFAESVATGRIEP